MAGKTWTDPLDAAFNRIHGGRWNAPESFGVIYLNDTVTTARANMDHKLRGTPYGPEDLDQPPVLVEVDVPLASVLDIVTDEGCVAVGLPTTYPRDAGGRTIAWSVCQPIGSRAYGAGLSGIACRSARSTGEELAWFDRAPSLSWKSIRRFDDWYWAGG